MASAMATVSTWVTTRPVLDRGSRNVLWLLASKKLPIVPLAFCHVVVLRIVPSSLRYPHPM